MRTIPWRRLTKDAAAIAAAALLLWPALLRRLFVTDDFMPHGHCYFWNPGLVRLHVATDALIWLSYVSISLTLAYLVARARRSIPFHWMFLAFGLFIIACGFTHFMEIVTLWKPVYWLSGYVKLVTAAASVATAVVLPSVVPKALSLIDKAKVSEERRVQLEEMNKELESLSYSLSHDLRTPLRTIGGFSHALLEDWGEKLDVEGRGHIQRICDASRRMGDLIEDMLSLSRMSRGEMKIETVDMSALARDVFSEFQRLEPRRKVKVFIPPGVHARGDANLLRAMLENLIGNAWKFTAGREEASIEFGVQSSEKGETAYFVRDNGVGFDMARAEKLFVAFQRLHGPEFSGTGVGLAAVSRAAQKHGGRAWAQGMVNRGASFFFTLGTA